MRPSARGVAWELIPSWSYSRVAVVPPNPVALNLNLFPPSAVASPDFLSPPLSLAAVDRSS